MKGIYLEYYETISAVQVGATLYDLDGKQLSVFESAFRLAYLEANTLVKESRVKDFNYHKIVTRLRESEEIKKVEFALKCGLLDEYRNHGLPSRVSYNMLMEELGYGTVNESALNEAKHVARVKQVLERLNREAIEEGWFKNMVNKVGGAVSSVAKGAVSVAKNVGSAVVKGATAVGKGYVAVGKGIAKGAVAVGKTVAKAAAAAGKAVWKGLKAAGSWVMDKLGKLGGLFLGFLKKLVGFAMDNLSKLIDVLIPMMDKLGGVFKIVPQLATLLTGAGGISCLLKAVMTFTGLSKVSGDSTPAAGASPDLKEGKLNEIAASLQAKRLTTGYIFQAAALFGLAAMGKPVTGGLYKSLNDGVSAALAAGKGKTDSVVPYIMKAMTTGGLGDQIKNFIIKPQALISKLFTTILSSVGGGLSFIIKKVWTLLGGEKLIEKLLGGILGKLQAKLMELIGGKKKAEDTPAADAPAATVEAPAADAAPAAPAAAVVAPPAAAAADEADSGDAKGDFGG